MAVLVLQSFAVQRCSAGGASDQEAFGSHVGGGPNRIADSLEAEHAVVDVHRNHVDTVATVSGTGGAEAGHGTGFGDAFFQDLSVLSFLVVRDLIRIDGLVKLSGVGVDPELAEHAFHSERT